MLAEAALTRIRRRRPTGVDAAPVDRPITSPSPASPPAIATRPPGDVGDIEDIRGDQRLEGRSPADQDVVGLEEAVQLRVPVRVPMNGAADHLSQPIGGR